MTTDWDNPDWNKAQQQADAIRNRRAAERDDVARRTSVRRCQGTVVVGTSRQVCDLVLDDRGQCTHASEHEEN